MTLKTFAQENTKISQTIIKDLRQAVQINA